MRRPSLLDLELAVLIGLLLVAFVWCLVALYR
ncbi:hypothetical protein FHS95_003723 [Sphingomonas naasensis]|nr:hypothetical protein [Sphingomonas naasensis]